MEEKRIYIAIDLKSFYASVECRERGLDPMDTNLVVADRSRTEKTICLAVSPALKSYKIPGRARLFEVVEAVKRVNAERERALRQNHGYGNRYGHTDASNTTREYTLMADGTTKVAGTFAGSSVSAKELAERPDYELDYIAAPPRMALYMKYSAQIYNIYLRYIAPEDIHVYSIDEVFMDVTHYLKTYNMTPRQLAQKMIHDVLAEVGITATAGIGTNLFLCKVAMDIQAKHIPADENGVRIAELDEMTYRRMFWDHRPLTDFWRVGRGIAKKLEGVGLETMGDIARCSLGKDNEYHNEDLLYRMFGVNAELLIDHAWGWEPTTIEQIKAYKPENTSVGHGQVLHCPYTVAQARIVVKEMVEDVMLQLMDKHLVTQQLVLNVGYDITSLDPGSESAKVYKGEVSVDYYGRRVPKGAHGTATMRDEGNSTSDAMEAVLSLYDRIANPQLLVRRLNLAAINVRDEKEAEKARAQYHQMDLFDLLGEPEEPAGVAGIRSGKEDAAPALSKAETDKALAEKREREKKMQQAMLDIKKKFGKNAIVKASDLQEGATAMERNAQIGGHKA